MKTEITQSKEITFSIRIPIELNEKILSEAEKEKRSRHGQIIYSLEKLFERKPAAKQKEK